jgi:hypothetical protein
MTLEEEEELRCPLGQGQTRVVRSRPRRSIAPIRKGWTRLSVTLPSNRSQKVTMAGGKLLLVLPLPKANLVAWEDFEEDSTLSLNKKRQERRT